MGKFLLMFILMVLAGLAFCLADTIILQYRLNREYEENYERNQNLYTENPENEEYAVIRNGWDDLKYKGTENIFFSITLLAMDLIGIAIVLFASFK